MKQLLFLSTLMLACGVASIASPFWGVLLYYGLAALRPQYIWAWALPVDVRWSLLAAIVILVSVTLHLGDLFRRARANAVLLLMLAYGVLIVVSVLAARNPGVAQAWATEYAKILLIAGIASLVIHALWQIRLCALVLFGAVAYIAYEINFMYLLQGNRLDVYHFGYGGLDNNGAGMMLAMAVPLAAHFATSTHGVGAWPSRIAAVVATPLLLHAVMLTYSRSAMLATSCGVLWQLAFHRPRWQAGAGAVAAGALILVLAGPEIREEFLSTRNYRQDESAQSRLDSWAAGWRIAWDHPFFGAGVRNSNTLTHNYGADRHGRTIHNQYIQIAADSGIPTAVVYIALLGIAFHRFHTARRICIAAELASTDEHAAGEWHDTASLCLALQTSLVTFAVSAMFLSVEVFELPWFIVVLAGVTPLALEQRMRSLEEADAPAAAVRTDRLSPPVLAAPGVTA